MWRAGWLKKNLTTNFGLCLKDHEISLFWLRRWLLFSGKLEGFLLHFLAVPNLSNFVLPLVCCCWFILPQKQRHRSLIYGGRNGSVSQKGGKLPFHFWSFSSRVLLLLLCLNNVRRVSIPRKKEGGERPLRSSALPRRRITKGGPPLLLFLHSPFVPSRLTFPEIGK